MQSAVPGERPRVVGVEPEPVARADQLLGLDGLGVAEGVGLLLVASEDAAQAQVHGEERCVELVGGARREGSDGAQAVDPGALRDAVVESIRDVLGVDPAPDTGGGTSDGRFFGPRGIETVELGPVNRSIHRIDEHVAVDDLERLPALYGAILERMLG